MAGGSTMTLAMTVNGISVSNNRLDRAGGLLSFQLTQTVDMVEEVKVTSSPSRCRKWDERWGRCR